MKHVLKPDLRYKGVEYIDFSELRIREIKYILLDLDNTIIDFDKNLKDSIAKWVRNAKKEGFEVYILSNTNKYDKVAKAAGELEIDFINNARKPFKIGFKKAIKKFNLIPEKTAMVGDQVLTDVVGANWVNMVSIYVDPIASKEHFYTKWKRPLEAWILKYYSEK